MHQVRSQLTNVIWGWVTFSDASIVEVMLLAGADGVVLDLEHTGIGVESVVQQIRIANLMHKPVCVRLPSHDFGLSKRVLDSGTDYVMFPDVRTLDEARACVEATLYKPQGTRGVGIWRGQQYDLTDVNKLELDFNEPVPRAILQIEDIAAFDELEDILSLKMLAGVFVGPYDLSASLGSPGDFESQLFNKYLTKLLRVCASRSIPLGFHQVDPVVNKIASLRERGFNFIAYGTDYKFVGCSMMSATLGLDERKQ